MLVKFFKQNGPGVILLIALISVALWTVRFIHPPVTAGSSFSSGSMPLFDLLMKIAGKDVHVRLTIAFIMVAVMAFLLVNFNTTNFFINERTYLPALIYFLAGGLFPGYQSLNPVIPASIFLMLATIRIIGAYRKQGVANNFFDAGILISTGSLFYADLIWFGLLLIIGIALIRTVAVSEIALSLLGLVTPYLITFGIYYVAGKDVRTLVDLITGNLFINASGYLFPRLTIVALIFTSIFIVVSLAFLITLLNNKKIKSRKIFSLLIWMFLISLAVYILLPSVSVDIVWITAIPASYILTHYLLFYKKKLVPEIFFSVFVILILVIQILYIKG
jgi:hypothetical protein